MVTTRVATAGRPKVSAADTNAVVVGSQGRENSSAGRRRRLPHIWPARRRCSVQSPRRGCLGDRLSRSNLSGRFAGFRWADRGGRARGFPEARLSSPPEGPRGCPVWGRPEPGSAYTVVACIERDRLSDRRRPPPRQGVRARWRSTSTPRRVETGSWSGWRARSASSASPRCSPST